MSDLLKTTLLGLFFGTFGTSIGGLLGVKFKNTSDKFLSFILSFASGLMTAIVCFDLIPEALKIANIPSTIIGIVFGIICMMLCEILVDKKFNEKDKNDRKKRNELKKISNAEKDRKSLLRTGIIVSIGLAIHNFPEGLAIGSGFEASLKLGYSLAVAICIHDIPEGISMAVPMKNGGMSKIRVMFYVVLSGVTTGVGAFFGKIIGGISTNVISMCLAFAGGAMLYIISEELIPESNKLYNGKVATIGNLIGVILGLLAVSI